ncbi:MAG TPA: AMP-binding protein [Pseudonocardia sp.]|nr:AMP-binding protein [Pseudonocardia sp.]
MGSPGGSRTIAAAFAATARARPDQEAIRSFTTGATLTWASYADKACRVATALRGLGLRRGDRVALMMRNRPEFHYVDMGVMLAGGTAFSIYNSSAPAQIEYLLRHADARIAIVEDAGFAARVDEVRSSLPHLDHVFTVEDVAGVPGISELLSAAPLDLEAAAAEVRPDDLATIIYTSGTTGDPKGVMLNHVNLLGGIDGFEAVVGFPLTGMRTVSGLPFAHIAERNATHYFHVCMGSHVTDCEDFNRFGEAIAAVHPEWLFGTPRLWEKFQAAIDTRASGALDVAVALAGARDVGREVHKLRSAGAGLPDDLAKRWADARAEVLEPLLAPLGLDALRIANSGAAPMPHHTATFWVEVGVPLADVYGLSEVAGTATVEPQRIVIGTAGRALPGLELRLVDPDSGADVASQPTGELRDPVGELRDAVGELRDAAGEVLLRGPIVFTGYLDDPVRTAEVLDADGWFHTGDIGTVDADGYLRIVDRKKELIVTSGGKNIAPALIEAALKESPLIGLACAIGEGRPSMTALVMLDPEYAPAWARERGLPTELPSLAREPALLAEVDAAVARANERFNAVERVRRHTVVGDVWLPDTDVLTPTAKLKRRGVAARYAAEIDAMYR